MAGIVYGGDMQSSEPTIDPLPPPIATPFSFSLSSPPPFTSLVRTQYQSEEDGVQGTHEEGGS